MHVLVALIWWLSPSPAPPAQAPTQLHCRIELAADAPSRRCQVKAPKGGTLRACGDADRRAGHCDAAGKGKYVAWIVATGPGRCRITDKHTKWKRGIVSAKLSKSAGASSTCDLYVELR